MEVLRMVLIALVNLLALAAIGALAFYRLREWRMLSGLLKVRRVRDVVFGSIVILIAASFASIVVNGLVHG